MRPHMTRLIITTTRMMKTKEIRASKMDGGPRKNMRDLLRHSRCSARIGTSFISMSAQGRALRHGHMLRNTLTS
jgi:hypothetical protein